MTISDNESDNIRLPIGALGKYIRLFLDYLRVECGLAKNTLTAYARDLRAFAEGLPSGKDIEEISGEDIHAFLQRLSDNHAAPSTRARMFISVRLFFKFCLNEGITKGSPCAQADSPKLWKLLPHDLSPVEVTQLLIAPLGKGWKGLRDHAILEVFYATGARASELCGMKIENLHQEEMYAQVRGKGSKERLVLLGEPAIEAIKLYLSSKRPLPSSANDAEYLFLSRSGRPLERTAVFRLVQRAGLLSGINKAIYPHLLRHSFATHMLEGGANLRVVQTLLGHSKLTTTEIYTHVTVDRKRDALDQFHPRP
jgi:integrase/recombinase XerD